MNIYSLKNKELVKLQKEFKQTAFGKRAKMLSMLPTIFFIGFSIAVAIGLINGEISQGEWLGYIISGIGSCIAQLMYGNMLKDYINAKKEEED